MLFLIQEASVYTVATTFPRESRSNVRGGEEHPSREILQVTISADHYGEGGGCQLAARGWL